MSQQQQVYSQWIIESQDQPDQGSHISKLIQDEQGNLYVDGYLCDEKTITVHGWSVEQAKEWLHSLLLKPYVLTEKLFHPPKEQVAWPKGWSTHDWLKKYLPWQEKYAIGRIRKIYEAGVETGNPHFRAYIQITNPIAKEAYKKGHIPKGLSIALAPLKWAGNKIVEAVGLHVAAVLVPAYGPQSVIQSDCTGSEGECFNQIKQAGVESFDCGFCVRTMLEKDVPKIDLDSSFYSEKIIEGSGMPNKLKLEDLDDETKQALLKELSVQQQAKKISDDPNNKPAQDPSGNGDKPDEEDVNAKNAKAPDMPSAKTADKSAVKIPPSEDPGQSEAEPPYVAALRKEIADLKKVNALKDEEKKRELETVRAGMVEQFVSNQQDENLKKSDTEFAMKQVSNDDAKYFLSRVYGQMMEVQTSGKSKKIAQAGVDMTDFVDWKAIPSKTVDKNIGKAALFGLGSH